MMTYNKVISKVQPVLRLMALQNQTPGGSLTLLLLFKHLLVYYKGYSSEQGLGGLELSCPLWAATRPAPGCAHPPGGAAVLFF